MSGEELKATFQGTIKLLKDEEFDKFGISKASALSAAKSLMPENFDPKKNIDVLPVIFNLAVVNKFNANGDGIDSETAINAVKRFANKPINIEHKKNKIVGHILNASLSDQQPDYNDNDIQSFAGRTDPYYITAAGVIYKHIYPELAKAIMDAADSERPEYQSISTSWELGFRDYKVIYGSDRLDESEVIEDESKANELKKYIKGFGGKGVDENGKSINRLIVGEVHPLGAALTRNPAANVSGVYLMEDEDEMEETETEDEEDDKEEQKNAASQQKNSLIEKNIVKIKKFKDILNMNDVQFEQFLQKLDESIASVTQEESQAQSIGLLMKDALMEHAESWKSQVQLEKETKEKVEQDLAQLQASFQETKKQLEDLQLELSVKAAAELFNSRMNFVEEDYALSEQELSLVAAEVKSIDSDEASFDAYKEKLSVIFAHKSKAFLRQQEEEIQAKIEEEVAKRLQTSTASKIVEEETSEVEEETELEIESAEASAVINNNADVSIKQSLVDKLKDSFSVEVKI